MPTLETAIARFENERPVLIMFCMHAGRDRVLLIDDDQFIAGSLKLYLLKDWDVDVARDVSSAEALMRSRNYDVIVIDPYLTGTSNEERASLMAGTRRMQPDAALIVLTGYRSTEMERAAADCGATALISKPQPIVKLGDAITSARSSLHLRAPTDK